MSMEISAFSELSCNSTELPVGEIRVSDTSHIKECLLTTRLLLVLLKLVSWTDKMEAGD